jgi:hypothetical protein
MGREIGREHEGGDQREIRLRGPIEENPADDGGARRIGLLHTSNALHPKQSPPCRNFLQSQGGVVPPSTAWWWRRKSSPRRSAPRCCGGRQRGRCRGRHRLCHGGDLSARRQYRRRRLHGDPFRRARRGHRHRLSRDRAGRDHARHFLGADGKPDIAKSRDSALGIGVPGTVAGLALALEKYGSGKVHAGELMKPAIALARDGFRSPTTSPTRCRTCIARLARWPSSAKIFSPRRRLAAARGDRLVQPISRPRSRRSPNRARAASMKGRSPKNWRRRCATPAAS